MNYRIRIKKLGSHWYPDIDHNDPYDLCLNNRIDAFLNVLDKDKSGELEVFLWETFSVIDDSTIMFEEADILRYLTTTDEFDLHFYVNDRRFEISSNLFNLIEAEYNPNFHKYFYKIEILNRTISMT